MKKYLIVNADDFGYYSSADEGIVKSAMEGIVTSATVVVNMPYAERAAGLISGMKELSPLSTGLHFNLTHGNSLCGDIPSLTDGKRSFYLSVNDLADAATHEDIAKELHAQINQFQKLFRKIPSHIDSHKHIHRKQNVLNAVIEGAKIYAIPVRSNSPYVHERLKRAGIATTDYFIGDVSVGPFWTKEKLITTLMNLPAGITELMCHPGFADKRGEYIGFYNAQREGELSSLCDDEIKQVIKKENIELISFQHFTKG